ncbi:hypothetical protein [Halorhabdus rudnickae]|uniref:hypothetical protein n=1 Tax=Halorhabdus rudnickae TaxID=1775544 RepID=UPI001FCEDE58|nr:hypothetical protein [Halorhabdus rudnickae]
MDRRRFLASVGVGGVTGLAGCPAGSEDGSPDETSTKTGSGTGRTRSTSTDPDPATTAPREETHIPFRVGEEGFERRTDDGYVPLTARGINLGMTKPGAFPGQAAITREEYDRWIAAMGEITNVVRTYTIHPPEFYRALAAYNESATDPLLVLQGTWVPTPALLEAEDASELSATVDRGLQRTVDVLHGATTLPDRPGHASGTYDADVSDATLGLLFGIEWPPEVVVATNEADSVESAESRYLQAGGAPAFERWLAGRLDRAIAHEMETYNTQHPAAFVNWVTTDPLSHPYEPFPDEDRVGIDPDAISATDDFSAGTFAAYHAYPYYPDLLNETPKYVEYVDHRGEQNSYAGYLNDLVDATAHPLVVAEFGVPSSRGIAHRHVHGRDQGRHTETRQGEIVAAMYEDIRHAGAAGGIAFAWQNEWFKRTWNLDARSVSGRRPFWSNIETPEQRFGLLAFDPVDGVSLGGTDEEWTDAKRVPATTVTDASARSLEAVRVTHDYEGLCVRLALARSDAPIDWAVTNAMVTVGLTGRSTTLPFGTGVTAPADFVAQLSGPADSKLLVESSYDAFAREFGSLAGLDIDAYRSGDAGFVPVREPVNLGYTVPATDERVPFDAVETGQLRYGNGDPDAAAYDSLTDVYAAPDGAVVELKLPWTLLNVADPSSKRRIQTAWESGLDRTAFDGVEIGVVTYQTEADSAQSDAVALDSAAAGIDRGTLRTTTYEWDTWNQPSYDERLKESYEVLRRSGWAGSL